MHSQQLKSSNLKQPVCGKRAVVRSSHVTPEQFRRECGRAHSSPTTDVVDVEHAEACGSHSWGIELHNFACISFPLIVIVIDFVDFVVFVVVVFLVVLLSLFLFSL